MIPLKETNFCTKQSVYIAIYSQTQYLNIEAMYYWDERVRLEGSVKDGIEILQKTVQRRRRQLS